jgi:hypothetical protein
VQLEKKMDFRDVADSKFERRQLGSATYRIAGLPDDAFARVIFQFKAPRKSKSNNPPVEEDEPITTVCGVENPFSGVFEEAEESNDDDAPMLFVDGYWVTEQVFSHHFHKAAFGKGLCRLSLIERQFECTIQVRAGDLLVISSPSKLSVLRLLMYLSEKSRSAKLPYTHFICIPLNGSSEFLSSMESLMEQITDTRLRGSFISSQKVHFTLAMLKLDTDLDIQKVRDILQTFSGILNGDQLSADLKGIELMDPVPPAWFKVAYTGEAGGGTIGGWKSRICKVADDLCRILIENGFLDVKKPRSFFNGVDGKLHATIINVKYGPSAHKDRSCDSDSGDPVVGLLRNEEWSPPTVTQGVASKNRLDGTLLLTRFRDYYFGKVPIKELRLCSLIERSEDLKEPDGFYHSDHIVKL